MPKNAVETVVEVPAEVEALCTEAYRAARKHPPDRAAVHKANIKLVNFYLSSMDPAGKDRARWTIENLRAQL